jgi:acyl-coenzyme A synthetase/AMP-(fatty) acid ligase
VQDAVVVGRPSPILGQVPVAYVIPAVEPTTADRLQDLLGQLNQRCAAELSRFKVPEAIYVVQDLPRAATGKVLRHRVGLGGEAPQTPYAGSARVAQGAPTW